MNCYFETKEKNDCNGCSVCKLRCPKNAIIMEEDYEGFLYPIIDKEKCINCGLCSKVCSNIPKESENVSRTFAAEYLDENIKKNSASGGLFYPIAKKILEKKGIVIGVAYDNDFVVKHKVVDNIENLKMFQGSKYVRSDVNDVYLKAEEALNNDRFVLFSGTPCQCSGMRSFLKKNYDKLFTCELICHANPSPKIFEMYKFNLETKYDKKISNINFRDKETGWDNAITTIVFDNNLIVYDASYYRAFVNELINRPSCYNCRFCTEKRYSDFSIGNLWGYEKIDSTIKNYNNGISLLNVNTKKAFDLLGELNLVDLKEVDTKLSFKYNHHKNVLFHKKREKFFRKIKCGDINENNIIDSMGKYIKVGIFQKIIKKIKKILKLNGGK